MALSARHALSRSITLPRPPIPRPGRRAVSLILGIGCLLFLVDAAAHPRATADLWTIDAIERLTGSPGAIAAGAAACAFLLVAAARSRLSGRA
jgi:hypothetical protein